MTGIKEAPMQFKPGYAIKALRTKLALTAARGIEQIDAPDRAEMDDGGNYRQLGRYRVFSPDVDVNQMDWNYIVNTLIPTATNQVEEWVVGGAPPTTHRRLVLHGTYYDKDHPGDDKRVPFRVLIAWEKTS